MDARFSVSCNCLVKDTCTSRLGCDCLVTDFRFPVELQLSCEGFLLPGLGCDCLITDFHFPLWVTVIFWGIPASLWAAIIFWGIFASLWVAIVLLRTPASQVWVVIILLQTFTSRFELRSSIERFPLLVSSDNLLRDFRLSLSCNCLVRTLATQVWGVIILLKTLTSQLSCNYPVKDFCFPVWVTLSVKELLHPG
jgi:hypothetical protein